MLRVGGLHSILFIYDASYTRFLHESSYAITGHLYALITKFIDILGTAVTRLALPMHSSNVALQLVLILVPGPNRMLAPVVIAATAHFQHFTHPLNEKFAGMFLYESEYLPSVLEKMLTTFFKISRSIWASRSSRCSLRIYCCSGVRVVLEAKG